jgi:uncharacterized protein (UPF0333 family)
MILKPIYKIIFFILIIILFLIGIYFIFFNHKNIEKETTIKPEEFTKDASINADNITKTYTNSEHNFSFDYPKEFKITEFGEEENKTILINNADNKFQFQIIISYFGESGPLTQKRILQDLPDLKMENVQQKTLKNGDSVLIFLSDGSNSEKTREVWFIYNEYLYQISALQSFNDELNKILATWKFN